MCSEHSHFYKCWFNALIVSHLMFVNLLCVFHNFDHFIWNSFQSFKASLSVLKCMSSGNSATTLNLEITHQIVTATDLVSAVFMTFFSSGFYERLSVRLKWACLEVKNCTACLSKGKSVYRWAWERMRLQCLKWLSTKISKKS